MATGQIVANKTPQFNALVLTLMESSQLTPAYVGVLEPHTRGIIAMFLQTPLFTNALTTSTCARKMAQIAPQFLSACVVRTHYNSKISALTLPETAPNQVTIPAAEWAQMTTVRRV